MSSLTDSFQYESDRLPTRLLATLAFAAGIAVANLYYSQPILGLIAKSFNVDGKISLIVMFTQIGYTLGLILLVPLGDQMDRRPLLLALCALLMVAAVFWALAKTFIWLLIASSFLGIGATTQLVVPLAADIAAPSKRGHAVGVVYGGALAGILLARVVSGAVGQTLGRRAMFWCAAAVAFVLGLMLRVMLPKTQIIHALWRAPEIDDSSARRVSTIEACLHNTELSICDLYRFLVGPGVALGKAALQHGRSRCRRVWHRRFNWHLYSVNRGPRYRPLRYTKWSGSRYPGMRHVIHDLRLGAPSDQSYSRRHIAGCWDRASTGLQRVSYPRSEPGRTQPHQYDLHHDNFLRRGLRFRSGERRLAS